MNIYAFLFSLLLLQLSKEIIGGSIPLVVNTWNFCQATSKAWDQIVKGGSNLDALESGCSKCEQLQCDGTVGFGGSPDENGETALDAMIFDGTTMNMGAVGGIRHIKDAISVARRVLENTKHSLLVGDLATQFAVQMGYPLQNLSTSKSLEMWHTWKEENCQPNFWTNVNPNPLESCGPYRPDISQNDHKSQNTFDSHNHDTIGMIVIDENGKIVAGTSSNGANHKIPGRVGDSPLPGAGAYADDSVGAAVATGDGDFMMRFLPSFLAVEEMRRGKAPQEAANTAISRIRTFYPKFFGAVIAVNKLGEYGASCNGMEQFPFCVANKKSGKVFIETYKC